MRDLLHALPDDRPVTALCVIEDVNKCPSGYTVVAKTHDQDLDADLWKDGIFSKRVTRYLCLSKTEGPSGFVIDSLCIINEKDLPPNGYILLSKTYGAEQRAWRKRQLCYRLSERSSVFLAITDIIILSKSKKAPEGFTLAGEANGLVICYKSSPLPAESKYPPTQLPYQISATQLQQSNATSNINPVSPGISSSKMPIRPAPLPPVLSVSNNVINRNIIMSTATMSGYTGLEGVPFVLGLRLQSSGANQSTVRQIRIKTPEELNAEYNYPFTTEREAMFRL